YITLLLSGLAVIFVIPQELFPPVTFPQLTIVTPYPNAAPEEIENLVTKLIEESIATVKNLKTIRSFSREGLSLVIAEFYWGTDMNFASLNLREKIDLVKERLPKDAEEPLVVKFNPFSKPIMVYSVVAKGKPGDANTLSMSDILKIAKERLKDKLEKVPGVASVSISGGQEREIHVDLNIDKLVSHKINLLDVSQALKDCNLNYPAGSVKEEFFEYLVRTMGEYQTTKDIEETLVSIENIKKGKYDRAARKENEKEGVMKEDSDIEDRSSQFVLVKDIAAVTDGLKEKNSYSRYLGKENLSLSVQKQAAANIIETVDLVKSELKRLKEETNIIPDGMEMTLVYDESTFIKSSINGVVKSAWMGGMLAFVVLYLFLHSFKSSLIVAVSIPVSALTACICMYFAGVSINMMSLGGLALGIGMLTDNAIVVVENIARHRTQGKRNDISAIIGSEEVFASVFSSTLTSIAVFLPLAFVYGISGELFKPISFTIVFSLTASLISSLTLIPRLTIIQWGKTASLDKSGVLMEWIKKIYGGILDYSLKIPKTILFFALVIFIMSVFVMMSFESEIMPKVDQGQFNVKITLPTGTILEKTNEVAGVIEDELLKNPDLETLTLSVGSDKSSGKASLNSLGSHEAQLIITLKKERKVSTNETITKLQNTVNEIRKNTESTALKMSEIVYTPNDNPFAGAFESSSPISINITGRDLNKLQELVKKTEEYLSTVKGTINIRNDIPSKSPEYRINPLREKASINGITASDVAQTSLIALKGSVATKLKKGGVETDVLVRVRKEDRQTFEGITNMPIFVEDKIVPIKEVADVKQGRGPSEIKRLDQVRIFHVYADLKGRVESEATKEIESWMKAQKMDENYFIGFGQEYEDKNKSSISLLIVFFVSILLVYMVMAAQFESLWQPFIIMMTVPLSVIGVALALHVTNTTLNAMSMLGLIMLCGIVVNNGIILLQFINDLREEGYPLKESIITGAKIRLRPILMTTATALLGLLPLALKMEEGSEFQAPMAIAVIGGLFISTLLTLFIIPAFYLVSEQFMLSFKQNRVRNPEYFKE
ncbi:MAG: hypothetical protein ACD_79C00421G0001, partial [uncultured bacterium]